MEVIKRAFSHPERTAIVSDGVAYSYRQLLQDATTLASIILNGGKDLEEAPITFMIDRSYQYPVIQWAIWMAGGIAVPVHSSHPLSSIEYILEDTGSHILITNKKYAEKLAPLVDDHDLNLINVDDPGASFSVKLPNVSQERKAMILYTSGTTGNPKGVVSTHKNIQAQVQALVTAWKWDENDRILNILPLHHVHGIINIMSCALWSGASCEFIEEWNSEKVWNKLLSGDVNIFMAVPTIYYRLIKYWNQSLGQKQLSEKLKHIRLMVSGSAALPIPVFEKWKKITGHVLLERYGMTEIGMALSNPYAGEKKPGFVGFPLPGVEIRLVENKHVINEEYIPGEIQVRGDNVFDSYWRRPQATSEAFINGWFKTGDIAQIENGYYRILGRNSVDIIKSGGYKISALEIENILLEHPLVNECAVVGLPDLEWGEIVGCCVVSPQKFKDSEKLKHWLLKKLPGYKIPRKYIFKDSLPKNAMGKVSKNEIKKMF